jgi:hypothetical protein
MYNDVCGCPFLAPSVKKAVCSVNKAVCSAHLLALMYGAALQAWLAFCVNIQDDRAT